MHLAVLDVLLNLHEEDTRKKHSSTLAEAVERFRGPQQNLSPEEQKTLEFARDLVKGIAGGLDGAALDRFGRDFLE